MLHLLTRNYKIIQSHKCDELNEFIDRLKEEKLK